MYFKYNKLQNRVFYITICETVEIFDKNTVKKNLFVKILVGVFSRHIHFHIQIFLYSSEEVVTEFLVRIFKENMLCLFYCVKTVNSILYIRLFLITKTSRQFSDENGDIYLILHKT